METFHFRSTGGSVTERSSCDGAINVHYVLLIDRLQHFPSSLSLSLSPLFLFSLFLLSFSFSLFLFLFLLPLLPSCNPPWVLRKWYNIKTNLKEIRWRG